jgi:glutamate-5-semialdehyde dehydrogenase
MKKKLIRMAARAGQAGRVLAALDTDRKNRVLEEMAAALRGSSDGILAANQKDLKAARVKKLSASFTERLTLSSKRLEEMASSLEEIARLDDPVGTVLKTWSRPNGLVLSKVRVAIGVIFVIYESRPNVTSDLSGCVLSRAMP